MKLFALHTQKYLSLNLLELTILFRTKRFFSLASEPLGVKFTGKILIQKLQALHIFARLCSISAGPITEIEHSRATKLEVEKLD